MSRRIRDDLVGVVYVGGVALKAGDEEPEGVTLGDHLFSGAKEQTVPELEAEIDRRNEGREEADLIKPASGKKADLVKALAADDSK